MVRCMAQCHELTAHDICIQPHYSIVLSQVRDFQAIIGRETKVQCREAFGGLPDVLLACVGGGSNAIGMFHDFVVGSLPALPEIHHRSLAAP